MNCVTPDPKTLAAACIALLGIACTMHASAQVAWPAAQANPQPLPDDVVLPMPCGGSMAFRRVAIASADALDDRRVQLGGSEAKFAYAENARSDYIGGGFTDPKTKNLRYYLMGKYEVTQLQYDALSGTCPQVIGEGRLPKTGVTWSEAIYFSGRYADWLVKNAGARLPAEDGAPGFVRLPTEAEWEFAARGGMSVEAAVFEQTLPPMPDGPQQYVWYAGTDSSNNELNPIGLHKPNPLGLHDMLGNAGEFVLDAFRLNKFSHLHGQAGGYTVKGGDFRTAMSDIRSAARTEYLPVDKNGERRDKATGLRLVLVPGVLPSPGRLTAVRTLWPTLAAQSPGLGPALADPVKEADAIAKDVTEPALKKRVEGLGGVIRANIQARNEQRDRSAKSEIRVGAYLAQKIIEDRGKIRTIEGSIAAISDERLKAPMRNTLAGNRSALDGTVNYMIDTLRQIGLDYPAPTINAQGENLKREFEARAVPGYGPLVDLVVRYGDGARRGQPIDRNALLDALTQADGRRR